MAYYKDLREYIGYLEEKVNWEKNAGERENRLRYRIATALNKIFMGGE